MKLSEFQYDLPKRLIAQNPAEQRTGSRLMIVNKAGGNIIHDKFINLNNYLTAGDCLVFNNTRVIPARLFGVKISASIGSRVELLLIRDVKKEFESGAQSGYADDNESRQIWEVMAKPGKRLARGSKIGLCEGKMNAEIIDVMPSGHRFVSFYHTEQEFYELIGKYGHTPLPPYIKDKNTDPQRYQTVYAKTSGSAAAPTAGLHFSEDYINKIEESGIRTAYLTLHIGPGTFAPVKSEIIEEHHMHSEYYLLDDIAATEINQAKNCENAKIICVGTTSMRTLESVSDSNGYVKPCEGWTDIYIYPGYKFKAADALLTNFHLPGSTLLMLVCAFAGYKLAMEAYRSAVENEYRFYSFGDAMLIIDL